MRTLVMMVVACLATGCGVHSYSTSDQTIYGTHKTEAKTGPFSSSNASSDQTTSNYQRCLARYDGWDGAVAYCGNLMASGSPGQMPQWGAYGYSPYGYGSYGYGTYYGVPYAR